MPNARKPPKKTASAAGRATSEPTKGRAASAKHGEYVISPEQLKLADEMLVHIKRRGEALSVSATRLLKRVS